MIRSYRLTVREEPLGDNRWRYELSCGHIIVRRAPGRVGCYCDECRNGWQAFCAWVRKERPGAHPEKALHGALQAFARSVTREVVLEAFAELQRRRPHVWTDAYSTELLRSLPFPA